MDHQHERPTPESYPIQIGAKGRLVLPSGVRRRLDLREGDRLVLTIEPGGGMRLVSLKDQVQKLQGIFRGIEPERDLVEELIAERREEAQREEEV